MAFLGKAYAPARSLAQPLAWPLTGAAGNAGLQPTLDIDFTASTTLDPRVTLTRATTVSGYDVSGALVSFGANVPVFEFDSVTHAPLGLRIDGETAFIGTLAPWFNSVEGTLVVEFIRLRNDGGFPGFGFTAGGGSGNSIAMFSENNNFYGLTKAGGAFLYGPVLGTVTNGAVKRCAVAYKIAQYGAAHDGVLSSDDGTAAGALPVVNQFRLDGLDAPFTGYFRRLRYYAARLNDADLVALTTAPPVVVVTSNRLSEAGDRRVTEAGDARVMES